MSIEYPTLQPNSKYLFQFIQREDGRKTKAFISTPNQVIYWLETQEVMKPEDLYVDFLCDIGAVNEVMPDESLSMADLILTVPLFSGSTFILCFKDPESYARFKKDLNRYDDSIDESNFSSTNEDQDNG